MKILHKLKRQMGLLDLSKPEQRFTHNLQKITISVQQVVNGSKTFAEVEKNIRSKLCAIYALVTEFEGSGVVNSETKEVVMKQLLLITQEFLEQKATQQSIDAVEIILEAVE